MTARLPVYRPLLPTADRLRPYLGAIDDSRTYANWGPLVMQLESRLAALLGQAEGTVVSASSGTAALVGAILAAAGQATPGRPLALVPGLTFVATAIAAEQCGYRPYVVDVDRGNWQIVFAALDSHPQRDRVGLVIAVAPFGRPVPQEDARAFSERTGIPVVIDGGACFEAMALGPPSQYVGIVPTALSFHATKSFSTAEGGGVVTSDASLARRVAQALSFGFRGSRNSAIASTNGKMSEYHAAVGLAELDGWRDKSRALVHVAEIYRGRFEAAGLASRFFGLPVVAGCYALFEAPDPASALKVQHSLDRSNAETRLWYAHGLLDHDHFRSLDHDPLEMTRSLASRLVGLPVAPDLSESQVEHVVRAVVRG
jgi:dTDP-4-amino-4,6-dideoxygalactose transaminase